MSASKMAIWKMLDLARLIAGRRLELRGDCSRKGGTQSGSQPADHRHVQGVHSPPPCHIV